MSNKCPRCCTNVYFAEEFRAVGKVWHKSCLTCANCRKRVDSTTRRDHGDEIYCKACYGRSFGPKGYGFAGGASGLSMDTGSRYEITTRNVPAGLDKAQVPHIMKEELTLSRSLNTCPVCCKAVYMAEQIMGPGLQAYHKLCFKCSSCNRLLDSTTLAEREYNIYCKSCYNKNFGPKGFGFGQAMQRTA